MLKSLAAEKLVQTTWRGPHRAIWIGALCGVGSAVGYTVANAFLRLVATSMDPVWVSTVKASCTVMIFGPWLAYLVLVARIKVLPAWSMIAWLVFAAVQVQVVGNVAFQWSLGQIGLAIAVPLVLGTMILGSAAAGGWMLGERISGGTTAALLVLFAAIVLLSGGTQQAGESMVQQHEFQTASALLAPPWSWIFGGIAACLSGLSYAVLGLVIRVSLRTQIPLATPMVFVGVAGTLGLGAWTMAMYGTSAIVQTTGTQWAIMLAAGMANATAFLALTMSLKLLPVVYVNAINVSQVAMAAVIGLAFFGESLSWWLISGLLVMTAGFGLLALSTSRAVRKPPNSLAPHPPA